MDIVPQWAIGVGILVIAVSAARALSRVLRGGGANTSRRVPTSDEAVELRQAIDAMQARLADVEERLDFAERTLAKSREADRLGHPPGSTRA